MRSEELQNTVPPSSLLPPTSPLCYIYVSPHRLPLTLRGGHGRLLDVKSAYVL
jgi:hypothetical protein